MPRFIPMLTFAIDHQLGGGSITQFHRTNIIIHLLATGAVFFFVLSLLQSKGGRDTLQWIPPDWFALFVAALWALNPAQTNGVTYLVQRMASLAALFYCLSCALYLRARLADTLLPRLSWGMGCVVAAVLAFGSKENTATLPVTLVLLEVMFLSPGLGQKIRGRLRPGQWLGICVLAFLLLPLATPFWNHIVAGYLDRPFTLGQRLLTEARVIVFYLSLLLLPLPGRMNLDHDFPLSHSLLSPLTTLWSFLGLAGLVCVAHRQRKKAPLFAFGIYWFLLTLLIESSVVPLEIIFEHRLYLPSIGIAIALLGGLDRLLGRFKPEQTGKNRRVFFYRWLSLPVRWQCSPRFATTTGRMR